MPAYLILGVYALLGNTLDATKVFTSLALFNQLRFPLIFFPITLNALAEGKVSLDRLTTFLLTDEIQNYVEDGDSSNSDSTKDCISISNGSFSYSDDKSNSTLAARGSLNDIDVHIKKGELVAVVGSTGSGKSTLLYSMLGELAKEKGSVMVNGSVAYVPQSSWIPNDSLRNVILFGNKMEWDKYRSVIKDCGLERDLQLLDSGDQTEIGERGVNLSGGQKQRVSIARAVYSDAEIFFFDDPLSALDAEVGAKLFKDCIVDRLHNKTRILVTHQLNVLPKVDRIIIMNTTESGSSYILAQGTLTELQSKGYDLKQLVSKDEESEEGENEKGQADHEERDTPVKKSLESKEKLSSENGQLPRALPVSEDESVAKVSTHPDYILTDPFLRKAVNVSGLNSNILVDIMPPLMGTLVECRTQECDENDQECQLESLLLDETGRKIPVATRIADEVIQSLGAGSGDSIIPGGVGTEDASTKQESSGTEETEKEVRKLMTVEDRAEGAVGWDVYKSYIKAANRPLLLFAAISSFVLSNVFQILQQWIVAAWTSDAGYVKRSLPVYLGSVAAMAGFVAGFTWLRTFLAVAFGASASRTIHSSMARRVLSAPLQYFGKFFIFVDRVTIIVTIM